MAIYQLRIYEVFEHNKQPFHARFRDHALRIMRSHGFHFLDIWETESEGRTEAAYLLRWDDEAAMKRAWERFRADEEWTEIKEVTAEQHGVLVGEIRDRVLKPVDYSPGELPS